VFHEIPAQSVTDISTSDAVLTAVSSSVYIFAGIFIARKLRD